PLYLCIFLPSSATHPHLHSFPTRRSSDLIARSAIVQQFRRMLFNAVARNQDDHVKNIAFLMDPQGIWSLAPAFDVTYAYSPAGQDRKSTRLNSSHVKISYAVFCLKKKKRE